MKLVTRLKDAGRKHALLPEKETEQVNRMEVCVSGGRREDGSLLSNASN